MAFLRSFRRAPGAAATATLLSALGVALVTVALALVDASRWRPLPFADSGRAVVLHAAYTGAGDVQPRINWSWPRLDYLRQRLTTIELTSSLTRPSLVLSGVADPITLSAEIVNRQYFDLLGVRPIEGRSLAPDEDLPGSPKAVVLVSSALRDRLRDVGYPVVPGTTLRLNEQVVTVIGIMPSGFHGLGDAADLWLPPALAPQLTYPGYLTTNQDFITLVGRRRPGITDAQAGQEVARLAAEAHRAFPGDDVPPGATVSGHVVSLGAARQQARGPAATRLLVAAAGALHLLTLVNLVALGLGRVVARRREVAVLQALGARPARLLRTLAADALVPLATGSLLGLAGAAWLLRHGLSIDQLLAAGRSGTIGTFSVARVDHRVAFIWLATTAVTILVATLLPAAWALVHSRMEHLKDGAHGSARAGLSLRRPGAPAFILAAEGALAVLLLGLAGQFVQSYRQMVRAELGVRPEQVLTFELQPSEAAVPPERAVAFIDRVLGELATVPGVVSASVDGGAPLAGSASAALHVVGRPDEPGVTPPIVNRHYVGPDHFETLGIPLRRGRAFTASDRADAPRVIVLSEAAARRFFPAGDAIGQRVWFEGSTLTSPDSSAEIVGIVGDVKYDPLLRERTTASFYTPYAQFTYGWRVYFVRTVGDPQAMRRSVTDAVHRVAPDLPLRNLAPLTDQLAATRSTSRVTSNGLAGLAGLAVLLAMTGIGAIVSHAMRDRQRELAIRGALGASPARLLRLLLGEGLRFPLAGLVIGVALAVAASRVVRALMFGVTPGAPLLVGLGAAVFALVATIACLLPAARAARDPGLGVLRAD